MKKSRDTYAPEELVEMGKLACDITKPNGELSDDEIRLVMRWVGQLAPDVQFLCDRLNYGPQALGLMLFVTESVFPGFYNRHHLSPTD